MCILFLFLNIYVLNLILLAKPATISFLTLYLTTILIKWSLKFSGKPSVSSQNSHISLPDLCPTLITDTCISTHRLRSLVHLKPYFKETQPKYRNYLAHCIIYCSSHPRSLKPFSPEGKFHTRCHILCPSLLDCTTSHNKMLTYIQLDIKPLFPDVHLNKYLNIICQCAIYVLSHFCQIYKRHAQGSRQEREREGKRERIFLLSEKRTIVKRHRIGFISE